MTGRWDIKDPWSSRVRRRVRQVLICTWLGHDRPPAFGGGTKPCRRCDR